MIPIPPTAGRAWTELADALGSMPPVPCSTSTDPGAWWVPADDQTGRASAARAACGTCPAAVPCLAYALAAGEAHGIWGGHTSSERTQLRADGS